MADTLAELDALKERLAISAGVQDVSDAYLTALLERATGKVQSICGRDLLRPASDYVEVHCGNGGQFLDLRQGPIASVTEVAAVTYDSAGDPVVSHVVGKDRYRPRGVDASQPGWKLRGYLVMLHGTWNRGHDNYRVTYMAGFPDGSIPWDLEEACLFAAVWMKNRRRDAATTSRSVGADAVSYIDEDGLDAALRVMLQSYLDLQ